MRIGVHHHHGPTDRHRKHIHLKIRDHICKDCGAAFYQMSKLKMHMKQVHLKIKDNACNECGSSFSQRCALMTHKKHVHQKIKSKCELCLDGTLQIKNFGTNTVHSKKLIHVRNSESQATYIN